MNSAFLLKAQVRTISPWLARQRYQVADSIYPRTRNDQSNSVANNFGGEAQPIRFQPSPVVRFPIGVVEDSFNYVTAILKGTERLRVDAHVPSHPFGTDARLVHDQQSVETESICNC